MGGTFPGKGRLKWGVDKSKSVGVGEGDLGDVIPRVEPVRSQAGMNHAGPPTFDRKAGRHRKNGEELGVIIGGSRRVEREDARHFNVILLLNSITEMRGRVVGEGLQERPTDARVVFRLWDRGGGSGREGKRETRHGGLQQPLGLGWLVGWMDGWINDYSIAILMRIKRVLRLEL